VADLPIRKHPRLKGYDYNEAGAYFLTFCTKDKCAVLGKIVGRGILDAPCIQLSEYGKITLETIEFLRKRNHGINIDKYAIMPNHVHLIVVIHGLNSGASGMPRPTSAMIPKLISSVKRFVNKQAGLDIWQRSYHDHIIRDHAEYQRIWQYIDENPQSWMEDCYYPK